MISAVVKKSEQIHNTQQGPVLPPSLTDDRQRISDINYRIPQDNYIHPSQSTSSQGAAMRTTYSSNSTADANPSINIDIGWLPPTYSAAMNNSAPTAPQLSTNIISEPVESSVFTLDIPPTYEEAISQSNSRRSSFDVITNHI